MRTVTRSEFSRISGVSPAAITKACKYGALVAASQGDRVDLDHPAAVYYLRRKGVDATAIQQPPPPEHKRAPASRPRSPKPTLPKVPAEDSPAEIANGSVSLPREVTWDDIMQFSSRSFQDVADMFATAPGFKDWLDALKKLEDTKEKHLKNEEYEGRLIERELVQIHVFGLLRGVMRKLLRDAPKTLSKEVYEMAMAGRPIEDAEKAVREELGTQIRSAKVKISRTLGGEGPRQPGEDGA